MYPLPEATCATFPVDGNGTQIVSADRDLVHHENGFRGLWPQTGTVATDLRAPSAE